jgi:hypothetical protein
MTYNHDESLPWNLAEYLRNLIWQSRTHYSPRLSQTTDFLPHAEGLLAMIRDHAGLDALCAGEEAYRKARPGSGVTGQTWEAQTASASRRFAIGWRAAFDDIELELRHEKMLAEKERADAAER